MTHLSLFSGIGGLDLAAEWAGFVTVGQCEWADFPRKVLEKHWPDVPRWRDVREITQESFYERTGMRTVDLISGGFPCQPFSVAGRRRGKTDDRYLWPEMFSVIQALGPAWVVGENVAGIVSMALDTVLSDLESIGYSCQAFIVPACAVDAPHRRDRCAIVAHANGPRQQRYEQFPTHGPAKRARKSRPPTPQRRKAVDDPLRLGCARDLGRTQSSQPARGYTWPALPGLGGVADGFPRWLDEPLDVPRTASGIKNRVYRIKALGNAVVPQQFYPIFAAIAATEREH